MKEIGHTKKNVNFWFDVDDFSKHCHKELPEFHDTLIKDFPDSTFYLFGSRSMEHRKDNESDWDFAIDQKDPVLSHLHDYGFVRKDNDLEYTDGHTCGVYERVYGEKKVQIVIKKSLVVFKLVWSNISPMYWQQYICKRSPSYLGKDAVNNTFLTLHDLAENVLFSLRTDVKEFM